MYSRHGNQKFIVRPRAPTVVAPHALLFQIEIERHEIAMRQLKRVFAGVQIFGRVMQRVGAQQRLANGEQAHAAFAQRNPADVHFVAGFAGLDVIGVKLVIHRAAVNADAANLCGRNKFPAGRGRATSRARKPAGNVMLHSDARE